MKRGKLYLNTERYEEERKRHKGEYHPSVRREDGSKAQLWVNKDIALILGYEPEYFTNMKKGRQAISETTARELGDVWGCNWKWLCGKRAYRTKDEEETAEKRKALDRFFDSEDAYSTFVDVSKAYLRMLGYDIISQQGLSDLTEMVKVLHKGNVVTEMPAYKVLLILASVKKAAEAAVHSQLTILLAEDTETAKRFMPEVSMMLAEEEVAKHNIKAYASFAPRWEAITDEERETLASHIFNEDSGE